MKCEFFNSIDASALLQMATQVSKSGNPFWFASRGLPGFASSSYLKGSIHISVSWHPI